MLEWCYSQYFHGGFGNALDEVPQTHAPTTPKQFPQYCQSLKTEKVDLAVYGFTDWSTCTVSSPCYSLSVSGRSGVYRDGCDYIEADLYDVQSTDWKGKQRMLHALAPTSNWTSFILVASTGWYNWIEIGVVTNDTDCKGGDGFTRNGYHVHHDFMQPTGSQYCQLSKNDPYLAQKNTDWQKENPDHWIHSLVHAFGTACLVPGPPSADFLLGPGGALDDTGAGTRSLSTGQTITTSSTCFAGTTWCGALTVTQPVLLAAYKWYRDNVKYAPPPSTSGAYAEWYNNGSYFFQYCGVQALGGTPVYFIYTRSSVTFIECGTSFGDWAFPGPAMVISTVQSAFSKFRGANGVCPSCPPAQQDANMWAQTQIDGGHWADVVKPALDAVIRPAKNLTDMHSLGITESPSFDGRQW